MIKKNIIYGTLWVQTVPHNKYTQILQQFSDPQIIQKLY